MNYQATFLNPKTGEVISKEFEIELPRYSTFEVIKVADGENQSQGMYPSMEVAQFFKDRHQELGTEIKIRKWAFPGPIPGNDASWVEYRNTKPA